MPDLLLDLSPANLIRAIESNIYPFFQAFRRWPRAEFHDDAEMLWTITDVSFSLLNSVMRARIPPEKVDAAIETVIAQGKVRHVPLLWMAGPGSQPADLGAHLLKQGFIIERSPGMAVDLARLKENLPIPEGFTFQRITNPATLTEWSRVFGECFDIPEPAVEAFCELTMCIGLDNLPTYLGRLNGKAVATSTLFFGAGVAGIYNVGTLPNARRKGIGALMTALPLREARQQGYRVGILQASEMGEPVYRSLGFQEYCKYDFYEWAPD